MFSETRAHLRTLTLLSLLSRVLIAALITLSAYWLPLFDSSPRLVLNDDTPPWISSLLRWDAFHFALVAQQGHAYEHTWAFFPALPWLMRVSGQALARLGLASDTAPLVGGALLAALCDSTRVLYRLSRAHLRSPSAAFVSAALSLLSSSPAALRYAAYTEPLYTCCAWRGLWACARGRWAVAAAWFALAGACRSNGVLLAGFLVWGMVVEPYLDGRRAAVTPARMAYCAALVALPLVPFAGHNYAGYVRFCAGKGPGQGRPGWCDHGVLPSVYAHVQAVYWDVGFLRYWTVANAPNFVLALPILGIVYVFAGWYLARLGRVCPGWVGRLRGPQGASRDVDAESLFLAPSLLPHVLHALVLALLLTFNAHVQIALRVLPSLPVVYWAAAWLLIEHSAWGRAWITWSVVWGAVSCVLWAVFLPPA